jgi:hypothetical protein
MRKYLRVPALLLNPSSLSLEDAVDDSRFDDLARNLASSSRRSLLKRAGKAVALTLGVGGPVGAAIWSREGDAAACRSAAQSCQSDANCCSGICGNPDWRGRRFCECPPNTFGCERECCSPGFVCSQGTCVSPTASRTPTNAPTNTPTSTPTATATTAPCPAGYDYINGACFKICNDFNSNYPGCSGLSGNMDGSGNYLCTGPVTQYGCTSNAQCPSGSACWLHDAGICYASCAAPV